MQIYDFYLKPQYKTRKKTQFFTKKVYFFVFLEIPRVLLEIFGYFNRSRTFLLASHALVKSRST